MNPPPILIDCGFAAVRVKYSGQYTFISIFSPSDTEEGRYAPAESCETMLNKEQLAKVVAALTANPEAK